MGTEDRPAAQFIPPMLDRVHPVVVFTVNDILDLAIEPTAPPASQTLPDDPAIRQSVSTRLSFISLPIPSLVVPFYDEVFFGCKVPSGVTSESAKPMWMFPLPSF